MPTHIRARRIALGFSKEQAGLASLRLELVDGRRLVGVRWPPELATGVQAGLQDAARRSGLLVEAGPAEVPAKVDAASAKRARTAAKTIISFFGLKPPGAAATTPGVLNAAAVVVVAAAEQSIEADEAMARRLQREGDSFAAALLPPSKRRTTEVTTKDTPGGSKRAKKVCRPASEIGQNKCTTELPLYVKLIMSLLVGLSTGQAEAGRGRAKRHLGILRCKTEAHRRHPFDVKVCAQASCG